MTRIWIQLSLLRTLRFSLPAVFLCLCVGWGGCEKQSGSSGETVDPPVAESVVEVDPENVDAALAAAEQYLNVGQDQEAKAILSVLVKKAPQEPFAHEMLGLVYISEGIQLRQKGDDAAADGKFAAAYERYRIALDLEPDAAGLQQNAGQLAHSLGKLDEALEHYRAAGKLDPTNPQTPFFAAQIYLTQGELDAADEALERLLKIDPDEPLGYYTRAMVARQRGDLEAALGYIGEAKELKPRDLMYRTQEAKIYREMGEPERALELMVGLSPVQRAQELVASEISAASVDLGDYERAALAWELCFEQAERRRQAYVAVQAGLMWWRADRPEKAHVWLKQAQILDPSAEEIGELENSLEKGPESQENDD